VLGVQASNGQMAFTRRGDLNVNELGQLTIGTGDLVMGDGGSPISVPLGQTLEVSSDGTVLAFDPNAPEAPASEVARLLLRDASATSLVRRLDGLFEPAGQVNVGGDFDSGAVPAELVSGAIEGSAVNVAEMLVKTMENNRSFEARIRLVKEFKDLDQAGTSMIRMA
jgi:flagellar basal-body rod protein FlgF